MLSEEEKEFFIEVTLQNCVLCHKGSPSMKVDRERYYEWQAGMHIQNAFPEMSTEQRELLMTGTHPKCWDKMMGEEE